MYIIPQQLEIGVDLRQLFRHCSYHAVSLPPHSGVGLPRQSTRQTDDCIPEAGWAGGNQGPTQTLQVSGCYV